MQSELLNYIKKAQTKKISNVEIKKNLLNSGWDEKAINDAFNHIQNIKYDNISNQSTIIDDKTESIKKFNTMSIVGFVMSFIFPPIGIIFCIIALVQINKTGERGKALAIIGLIIGLIIPLLVVIGAIAFIGVLNPNSLIQDKCTSSLPFSCNDNFQLSSNNVILQLTNENDLNITVTKISIKDCSSENQVKMRYKETKQFTISNCNLPKGKQKLDFKIDFFKNGPVHLQHSTYGTIIGTVN